MAFQIESYKFFKPLINTGSSQELSDHVMGTNWPVVYLIHGKDEIYIGETNSATGRMEQHLDPKGVYYNKRKKLDTVEIVFDPTFNKSAILDIENSLISLFRFEIRQTKDPNKKSRRFKVLQNGNSGQSKLHNYYHRAYYQEEVEEIWAELIKRGFATNSYQSIVNDTIFKFSPYTTLNEEQRETSLTILNGIMDALEKMRAGNKPDYTAIVNGVAGTGKTIILINLLARIVEAMYSNKTDFDNDESMDATADTGTSAIKLKELSPEAIIINRIHNYVKQYGLLRIGYVAQMTSLRNTIGTVIKELPHIHKKMAMGPFDVVNYSISNQSGHYVIDKPFDILLVDEAHRLWQNKKIMPKKLFREQCKKLYGQNVNPDDYTTLDWILNCSRTRVIVYDEFQTVKESDITKRQFDEALKRNNSKPVRFFLKQQMRCRAGMDYITLLDSIFNCSPVISKNKLENYELYIYEDANKLINDIIIKDGQVGLSKVTAGYGWQWNKPKYDACNKSYQNWIKSNGPDTRAAKVDYYLKNLKVEDGLIDFNGHKYVRNIDYNWILKGDPREIGCIHTSQGYDLNYVGVLFGPEIDYNPKQGIVINRSKIMDTNSIGKSLVGLTPHEKIEKEMQIKSYIINTYKVMMERGIKGCYVYAHNKGLRDYLGRFILSRQ